MKKISYVLTLLICCLNILHVYALTYDLKTSVNNNSVKNGSVNEIKVTLNNIQGTNIGISICSLNILLDNNLVLDSNVRTLNSWTMTKGDFYLFDTASVVTSSSDLFVIPVKVNGNGSVRLTDIQCSDGETIEGIDDKRIEFTVNSVSSNNQNNNTNNNQNSNNVNSNQNNNSNIEISKDSNCDLSGVSINGELISLFEPSVTDYNVKVENLSSVDVVPSLASDKAAYVIEKMDNNSRIFINVIAEDGTKKTYSIFLEVLEDVNKDGKKDYSLLFIIIICILVGINILRIVINKKNNS